MKVRVEICKTIEVEISDKHRSLALPLDDPDRKNITAKQLLDCLRETAEVVGLPWEDDAINGEDSFFFYVESAENGYPMCEL